MNTGYLSGNASSNLSLNSAGIVGVASAEAVQSRLAFRMTALMSEQAEKLPYDVLTRLRFAREKAVQHARLTATAAHQAASSAVLVAGSGNGGALSLHPGMLSGGSRGNFGADFWTRLGSVLPLIALVLGLLCIQHFHQRSQISAAAEVDAALLGDDLPVLAYSDPGFVEFLKSNGH